MRKFPIMHNETRDWIPWTMLAPHENQAEQNHAQSLETLARRGGLDASEAVAVLLDQDWDRYRGQKVEADRLLTQYVRGWNYGTLRKLVRAVFDSGSVMDGGLIGSEDELDDLRDFMQETSIDGD